MMEGISSNNQGAAEEMDDYMVETTFDDTEESLSTLSKVRKRKTSKAWDYFVSIPSGIDGKERAKCRKCGQKYVCGVQTGTKNMVRHYKKCFGVDATTSMQDDVFDPLVFRKMLVDALILHDLPLQFVEYKAIRSALHYANKHIIDICRNTAKADVFKIFLTEKTSMINELRTAPGRISLTTDLWTSIATDGYISLTAHYIDRNWKLQKRVLNFRFMPTPHSGVAISEKIYELLNEWDIGKKIFSMTLDNATANTKFIMTLKKQLNLRSALVSGGEFLHLRCCSHILNLIVQEGLKGIDASVMKIRMSVNYFKDSQARKEKFLECVKEVYLDGKKKGLAQDVPTRWNSTYLMLESALFFRPAFHNYKLSDMNFNHCPSEEEWEKIESICTLLGVFYRATCVFSGQKYPTSNLYFLHVFEVKHELQKALDGENQFMHDMAVKMNRKFEKYWTRHSLILAIAIVLDPRFKLDIIKYAYTTLYGEKDAQIGDVKAKLEELFMIYSSIRSRASNSDNVVITQRKNDSITSQENLGIMKGYDNFVGRERSSSTRRSELDVYLDEETLDRHQEIDILYYWKSNALRFPILAMLARDVLSIPLTTVASEAAFSNGSRVVDKFRSALTPKTVEALVCTRDWMFGKIDDLAPSLDELVKNLMEETKIDDEDGMS